jgi:hypothetical protein
MKDIKMFTTSKTASKFIKEWLGNGSIEKVDRNLFEIKEGNVTNTKVVCGYVKTDFTNKKFKNKTAMKEFAFEILTQMVKKGIRSRSESLLFGIKEGNDIIRWINA